MFKRLFDIATSTAGLILLSPLLVILAILVRLDSPGPIFYGAARVGRYGKIFKLFKFRSMIVNADQVGPGVTGACDPRITRAGRFLRRTKLDELPQLFNVLRGEMSIVGPRPEDPRYVAFYTDEHRQVLNVRPGITSPASVVYRNEEAMLIGDNWEQHYIKTVMPAKLKIDLEYSKSATIWGDLRIIWVTFMAIMRR